MSRSPSFKATLKEPNRLFLDLLKKRYRLRSASAALNRLLDQERNTTAQPAVVLAACFTCKIAVPTVNVNKYVFCPKCKSVFAFDNSVRWAVPPKSWQEP